MNSTPYSRVVCWLICHFSQQRISFNCQWSTCSVLGITSMGSRVHRLTLPNCLSFISKIQMREKCNTAGNIIRGYATRRLSTNLTNDKCELEMAMLTGHLGEFFFCASEIPRGGEHLTCRLLVVYSVQNQKLCGMVDCLRTAVRNKKPKHFGMGVWKCYIRYIRVF